MNCIRPGDSILVIWNNHDPNTISELVQQIKWKADNGFVVLENSEMITEDSRPHSSFDVVVSNWLAPYAVKHTDSLLALIVKLLKPSGKLVLKDETDLMSALKINGFVNVFLGLDNIYIAEKPNFEVGSKASLKLNGRKPAVWKLDDTVEAAWTGDDDDDETIDDNELLDEDDLKKPDKKSLRGI